VHGWHRSTECLFWVESCHKPSKPESMSLIALLLLSAPAGSGSTGPTSQAFAKALAEHTGRQVNAGDLRRLSCKGFGADEPPRQSVAGSTGSAASGNGIQPISQLTVEVGI
jgi:hypothetical protein